MQDKAVMQPLMLKMKRVASGILGSTFAVASPSDDYAKLIATADAKRDRREWTGAADAYAAALELKPCEASIWVQLGNTSKEAGDFVRARNAYGRALLLQPNDADTHLQIGHLHKLAGKRTETLASYVLANLLDPNDGRAAAELRGLMAANDALPNAAPAPAATPSQITPPPPTLISPRWSFDARVLGARNALKALLDGATDLKPRQTARLDKAQTVIFQAVSALEAIMLDDSKPAGLADGAAKAGVPIVFDVSDLIQYFRHHRLPTGIQRVQIEGISAALLGAGTQDNVRICCFTEQNDYWREVPPDLFLQLCELSLADGDYTTAEWRAFMADLDRRFHQDAAFRFDDGAFLINIGTSWWLQNYFLHVREAKRRSRIRYVPFVHDMIPVMTPEHCVEGLVKDFIGWAQGICEHADFYFVNSESTRSDLMKVGKRLGYDIKPDCIRTVRLDGDYRKPDIDLKEASRALTRHRLAPQTYVLFVSTIEARKNHVAMFDAWLDLCKNHDDRDMPKLVCVGTSGWLNEAIFAKLTTSKRLRDKVVMLSSIADDELAVLYRDCLFSVYPSLYEGWGLPVTEALCYGKAVLASRSSSLPEAGGAFVDYFELGNAVDLLARLQRLIFDTAYRQEREAAIRDGFRARTWRNIAEDFVRAPVEWKREDQKDRQGHPVIELGRYYGFNRNNDIAIYPGMRSGEIFRSGNGWWGANEWGCWLKPGPAEIAFTLPEDAGACRLCVGLRNEDSTDSPFDVTIMPQQKTMGVLKAKKTKWVVLEFNAAETGREVQLVVEGFCKRQERPRADLNPVMVSIAAVGLFVCKIADSEARARFAEAVSLDDMTSLMGKPYDRTSPGLECREDVCLNIGMTV